MNLYSIIAGNFMLDGGAMFGVVPKSLWSKLLPNENNMVKVTARCLLVDYNNQLTLIDTGMGNKQSEKFFSYYNVWGKKDLSTSLKGAGFHPDEINNVFLTHLHFDHCGGATKLSSLGPVTSFKNAYYWSNKEHWDWATKPNKREKASFLTENLRPLEASGQLKHMAFNKEDYIKKSSLPFDLIVVDGHTEKQMIPIIKYKNIRIAFAADLIPTAAHIGLPYIASYDVRPLLTLKEKDIFLNYCCDNNVLLFFEHDVLVELASLKRDGSKVVIDKNLKLSDL